MISLIKKAIFSLSKKFSIVDRLIELYRDYDVKQHRKEIDTSYAYMDVIAFINKLDASLFPMFGTLISIHRDNCFKLVDDYDFATTDPSIFTMDFINTVESHGAKLIGFSVVNHKIVELSFDLNNVRVDIFYLEVKKSVISHVCPNFRTSTPTISHNDLKIKTFTSFFQVDYPMFDLSYNEHWKLYLPSHRDEILYQHYGKDWRTPKLRNFIDYSNYTFINKISLSVEGNAESLKKEIIKQQYFNNFVEVANA